MTERRRSRTTKTRGKPRRRDRPVRWCISIPESLAERVIKKLDPVNGEGVFRVEYASRSNLIRRLLELWLSEPADLQSKHARAEATDMEFLRKLWK